MANDSENLERNNTPNQGSSQRVSFSIETLRTEINLAIAQLKLDLIGQLASKADVASLDTRLAENMAVTRANDKWITAFNPLIEQLQREHGGLMRDVENLKTTKAEETAVANFKKYLVTGGVLAVIFMGIQVAISIYLATHGIHHK